MYKASGRDRRLLLFSGFLAFEILGGEPCFISAVDCVAIFRETRRDIQVALGSEKFGDTLCLRRPAFARRPPRLATIAARYGSHHGLTPGSVALHLVSARARAADSDKTPGPPGYAGLLALLCSSNDFSFMAKE